MWYLNATKNQTLNQTTNFSAETFLEKKNNIEIKKSIKTPYKGDMLNKIILKKFLTIFKSEYFCT